VEWWGFWWLIFPVMGVVGGAVRRWQRGAPDRHERRLEILRAKGELRAARTGVAPIGAASVPSAPAEDTSQHAQLEKLLATHDDVTHRWLDYELDVAKLIAFPAMSDGRQPLTAAFLRAKKVADGLRPDSAKAKLTKEQFAEYRSAVTDFEVAFDVAERDARRIRDSSFSPSERKRLDTAQQLLTVAVDQAATPAERQLAYRRVREELDGLISISDEAIDVLEKKVALELTTGAAPVTTDATTTVTSPPAPASMPSPPAPAAASAPPAAPAPAAGVPTTAPGRVIRPKSTN
jgi:hypothetical protein